MPTELEVPPDKLQVRLDFYQNSILMFMPDDGKTTTRMISARDLSMALLRNVPLHSGILPENTVWWAQTRQDVQLGLWRDPRIWHVGLQFDIAKPAVRFRLPMPGLIFVCSPSQAPAVYAAKKRPVDVEETIYKAPLFNIFADGRSCAGSHRYPKNMHEIPESFFASFFSPTANETGRSQKYPNDLLKLWKELDGQLEYPLDDLVPCGKVRDLIK